MATTSRWQSIQVENEFFELPKADIKYFNLLLEEWNAITSLADDRNIIIKKGDTDRLLLFGTEMITEWKQKNN